MSLTSGQDRRVNCITIYQQSTIQIGNYQNITIYNRDKKVKYLGIHKLCAVSVYAEDYKTPMKEFFKCKIMVKDTVCELEDSILLSCHLSPNRPIDSMHLQLKSQKKILKKSTNFF